MVKTGKTIESYKIVKGKRVRERLTLNKDVFFPEKPDGQINLMTWYLTENEALFFEEVKKDKLLQKLDRQIKECYAKKKERWNFLKDKFRPKAKG